ncbi:hypothetical protein FA95DRAFT_1569389 [Auriscalpium vulgare]|uniref:Uncharacterized protein n=1 Tax=Auriscalpium vulgare TaxID=40419 RepID=A0ACB8S8N5_9AGAM|nr:hypothetical protein FA95DRAFT_1569389 [Auriscalpium vulgare]
MPSSPPPARWNSPPPLYAPPAPAQTTLTPYLQRSHRLSLTWLAYPILSLLFIVFRLSLSSDAAQSAVGNAKGDLLASCQAAQQAASSTASMPRFMAAATNEQIADAVNGTMNAARATLVLALTIMEAIINFIVDIYRSTFLCFVELVVRGGLSLIIGATQEISSFLTTTFGAIRTNIQNDVSTANSAIATAVNAINKVNPFSDIKVPQFDIPSLAALQNVTLPTDFTDALTKLNASLPSISQLKNAVNDVHRLTRSSIDTPFELVKQDINDTFATISFNSSVLPLPDRNTLTFCDNMDTSVVDDLGRDLLKITKIGIVLLVAVAFLLLLGNCALEWYRWRCLKQHMQYTREAWQSDPTMVHTNSAVPSVDLSDHNLMLLSVDSEHPLLTRIANRLSGLMRLSPGQHINLRWFLHYIFHPPALACFLIGFFGLLSVQLQLIAIHPLEARYQERAQGATQDFSRQIAASLNESMYNQSAAYAGAINARVDDVQSTINDGLFGWVNGTTTTLNDTLNTFYSDIQNAVSTVFNGTILEEPAQEFVRCFIGSKVDAFEAALTFLHDNLHVDMPRVNESVLVLSPAAVDEATQPIAAAAIGGSGSGSNGGLIGRLVNTYIASLKKERLMFAIFLGLWGVVVLMGLSVVWWHSYGRGMLEERRRRRFQREQRAGIDSPFRSDSEKAAGGVGALGGGGSQVNGSFTPMPSPKPPGAFDEQNDSNDRLRPGHPLTKLIPNLGKSFDSFFDHAAPAPATTNTTSKFNAFSRRITLRNTKPSATSPTPASPSAAEKGGPTDAPETDGWWKRMTRSFWTGDEAAARRSFRRAHRPQLTISTDRAMSVRDSTLPAIERTSPSIEEHASEPRSHWSLSPVAPPRTKPWMLSVAPTHAKPRASVPVDVGGSSDDVFALIDADAKGRNTRRSESLSQSHLAVPLHHGFAAPPAMPAPAPIPASHRPYGPPPGLRAVNPFVTPFDDEARVKSPDTGVSGRFSAVSLNDDPFSGRAF